MYRIDSSRIRQNTKIILVGTGGTGGFLADQLCRLFTGREMALVLVDHDQVEPHNLLRQAFYAGDVGHNKAEVLAKRLSNLYQRPISYYTGKFSSSSGIINSYDSKLIISCVDNAQARLDIESNQGIQGITGGTTWWIDAGNGQTWGQVLIGNTSAVERMRGAFEVEKELCNRLPSPMLQRPDLRIRAEDEHLDIDCAAALDLREQDPTINATMACLVTQMVRRLMAGDCPYMALYLDLNTGTLTPHLATPENVERTLGGEITAAQLTDIPPKWTEGPYAHINYEDDDGEEYLYDLENDEEEENRGYGSDDL